MDSEPVQGLIWLLIAAAWGLINWWGRRSRARRVAADAEPAAPISAPDETGGGSVGPTLEDLLGRFREVLELPDPFVGEAVATPEPPAELPAEPSPAVEADELPQSAPSAVPAVRRRSTTRLARSVLRDLRGGRRTLIRGMVLLEVLGPPVALRRGGRRGD